MSSPEKRLVPVMRLHEVAAALLASIVVLSTLQKGLVSYGPIAALGSVPTTPLMSVKSVR